MLHYIVMGRKCFIPSCKSGYDSSTEEVTLFKVPQGKLIEWQKIIARKDRQLSAKDAICEKHFMKEHVIREVVTEIYQYPLKQPRLAIDAVPCIFPGCPKDFTKEVRKRLLIKHSSSSTQKKIKFEENTEPSTELLSYAPQDHENSAPLSLDELFTKLWIQEITINLPSRSWATSFVTDSFNENSICFLEATCLPMGNIVLKKKIIFRLDGIKLYIFDHLIQNISTTDYTNLTNAEDDNKLSEIIKKHDSLYACYGVLYADKMPPNFQSASYFKDPVLNVWRHHKCTYIIEGERQNTSCGFCAKVKQAAAEFRYRIKNKRPRKSDCAHKQRNMAKREKRLRIKNAQLLQELQIARQKIKNIANEKLVGKIEN